MIGNHQILILEPDETTNDTRHVRVEFTANRQELLVGISKNSMLGFADERTAWNVPKSLVRSRHDFVAVVLAYAKHEHCNAAVSCSGAVIRAFHLVPGENYGTLSGD